MYIAGIRAGIYPVTTVVVTVVDDRGVVNNGNVPAVINIVIVNPRTVDVLSWYKRPVSGGCVI